MAEQVTVRVQGPEEREERRYYRVERRFSEARHASDMVMSLLRAHSNP